MLHKVLLGLRFSRVAFAGCNVRASPVHGADDAGEIYTLPILTVRGQETANVMPVSTYESVVSNLDFDLRGLISSRATWRRHRAT